MKLIASGVALAASLSLTVSACGSDSSSSSGKTTIRIGYFPDISTVSLMQSEKLLEKAGYDVKWVEFLKGVPQEAAAMVGGSIDMIWANASASIAMFSKDEGLAQLVGQVITNDNQVVVPEGSDVTSAGQLAGQTVSTTGLQTAPHLVLDLAMAKAGKDPKTVKAIQAGGPQQVPTLQQKAAAAAATYLPFGAQMALNGGKVLVTADQALGAPFPGGGWIVSTKYAKANPKAVVAVLKASEKAKAELQGDSGSAATTLAKFANTSADAIKYSFDNHLVSWAPITPNMDALTKVAQAEMKYDFVDKGTDLVAFLKTFVNTDFAQQAQASN